MSQIKSNYILGIDGLRAIAVLSVIIFHFFAPALPGGFSGVDIFFVVSGYVVSNSLSKETPINFRQFVINFYARRVLRIYPALLTCLVFSYILMSLFIPSSWLNKTTSLTGLGAFFGISNYILILFNDGYFSPRVEFNIFTHTWSLAVEEQFYFLFPAIFYFFLKYTKSENYLRTISRWILPILFLISLLYSWHDSSTNAENAYYLLPSRFWELASGAILFQLHHSKKMLSNNITIANIVLVIGLILITTNFLFADPKYFPFPWAIPSVLGTLFVISSLVSLQNKTTGFHLLLQNKPMQFIGKLSYSLYLWHWPILVIFRWTVGLNSMVKIFSAVIIIILMSLFSYYCIEKSIHKIIFIKNKQKTYILSRGILIICVLCLMSVAITLIQPYISLSVTKNKQIWYPEPWFTNQQTELKSNIFLHRKIFVLGDSHTGAYSRLLEKLTEEYGVEVHKYTKGGCPIFSLLKPSYTDVACAKFMEKTLIEIQNTAKPGDIIFLASLRMNRIGDQWAAFNLDEVTKRQQSIQSKQERALALQETDKVISMLENKSLIVLMDAPKPVFLSPAFRCADWFNSKNPICEKGSTVPRDFLLKHREPIMQSLLSLKKTHSKLIIWDTFPVLCPSDTCSAFDNDKPIFFDGDHLSGHGNLLLYPYFVSLLNKEWNSSLKTK